MPDHSVSLSVEQHPIAVVGLHSAVISPEDGDGLGVNLRDDGVFPRCEVRDINELPCLCAQPEHLHRAKILATITLPACDVALLSQCH